MPFSLGTQDLRGKSSSAIHVQANNHQNAVDLLNTLQTPFRVLRKRRDAGTRLDETVNDDVRKCLDQIGYSVQRHFSFRCLQLLTCLLATRLGQT
jgi:folylpolyglutamate synthase